MVGRNIQREFDVLYPAFSAALAETIAWCTRADRPEAPHAALWSQALGEIAAPDAVLRTEGSVSFYQGVWGTPSGPDSPYTPGIAKPASVVRRVQRVAATRRQLIAERGLTVPASDASLHEGRLLAYDPEMTDFSGGPPLASRGFFDEMDGPGWDAWVMAFDPGPSGVRRGGGSVVLLAWVPRDLLTTAAEGVLANPTECIWWPPRSADAKACLMSVLAGTAG